MNTTTLNLERLRDAISDSRLVRSSWGFDNAPKAFVCALSAVVPGCRATQDACPVLGAPSGALDLFLFFYDNSDQYADFALAFFEHDLPSKDWSATLDRFTLAMFARMPKNISRSVHACEFLDQVAALVAERAAAPPHRRTTLTLQLRALAYSYDHPATLSVGCALDIAAGDYVDLAAQSARDAGADFEHMKQDFLNTINT